MGILDQGQMAAQYTLQKNSKKALKAQEEAARLAEARSVIDRKNADMATRAARQARQKSEVSAATNHEVLVEAITAQTVVLNQILAVLQRQSPPSP